MFRIPSDERLAAALFSSYKAAAPAFTWMTCLKQANHSTDRRVIVSAA
jgi:hypothetical protein